MENEILDYEEKEKPKTNYRKYYLLIESIIVFFIFWLIIIGGSSFGYRSEIDILIGVVILPFIFLFYLVTPIIKFNRKESTSKLALLYFIQNITFVYPMILILYFEFSFVSSTLIFLLFSPVILWLLLFIIIPHLELKKYNASKTIHVGFIFIHISIILSFLGFLQYTSNPTLWSRLPLSSISLLGFLISVVLFSIMLFFAIRNWEKYFYLGYYFPRLLFAIFLSGFQIFFFLKRDFF